MKGEVSYVDGRRLSTTEYRSWQMMKNRCLNPRATDYDYYGGRGIKVTKRWLLYDNFLADMGRKPNPAMTLDRKDNEKGYCKSNCRWATRRQQSQNRGAYNTCSQRVADKIRRLYKTGKYYQYELGALFGLTQAHVSQITRGVAWPPK